MRFLDLCCSNSQSKCNALQRIFSGGGIILPSDLAVRKWDSGKVIGILKQDEIALC